MNIRKTLQASPFSFIVLNLVEKAILHFLLIMVDYVKGAMWKHPMQSSLKENHENTKKIIFQGEVSPALYWKLEESAPILAIYGLDFSFKIQLLGFSKRKNPKIFPLWHFFCVCFCWNVYQVALIPRKLISGLLYKRINSWILW